MKLITPIIAGAGISTTVAASIILPPQQAVLGADAATDRFLIELDPGETKWIVEDEKWKLRRVCALLVLILCIWG